MEQYKTTRNCIICDNKNDVSHYCSFHQLEYVKCNNCGLIYVDNFADNEQMYGAYTGGRLKSLRRKLMAPFRKMRSIKGYTHFLQRARDIFSFSEKHLVNPQQKNYLDIGCNKGFLLAAGIENNFNVHGVELVTELIKPFCNTFPKYSDQVYSDKFSLVSKKFDDGYFDLITAIDVVEHFEDPLVDLKDVYRVLNNKGVFIIQTPDISCQQAKALGCGWGALKPLEHLHLFDGKNFSELAKKAGFSEITVHDAFEEADGNFVAVLKK